MEDSHPPIAVTPTKKRLIFTTLAALLFFILCFALLEAYVRLTRPKIDLYVLTGRTSGKSPMSAWALLDAFSAYRAKPGKYYGRKMVNQHGFISTPEIAVQKPEHTVRVVFLGSSSTAGTGRNLKDEETWPWQTIKMLRQKVSVDLDFINGALGGYTSFESYGRLWSRIRHFSPDIVVLCHGWNEMYYFRSVDDILSWRTVSDGSWSFERGGKRIVVYAPHSIDPLIHWSQALTVLRLTFSRPVSLEAGPAETRPLEPTFDRRGLDIWRTHLRLFRETCRTLGIKLFVVKQATLITPDLPVSERGKCRYERHGFDHEAHVEAFQAIYEVIDEEISRDSVIDLTSLSGRPDFFFDHVHPTPEGARRFASLVSIALADYLDRASAGDHALHRTARPAPPLSGQ